MKLSDAINTAEEALHQIRLEIADTNYWGGPDPDLQGTEALKSSAVVMRQMIEFFRQVDQI